MIFFDLDGTLINDEQASVRARKEFYEKYREELSMHMNLFHQKWVNIALQYEEQLVLNNLSFDEFKINFINRLFPHPIDSKESIRIYQDYLDAYERNFCLYGDVLTCLKRLKENGMKLGIISNGVKELQIKKLKNCGIDHYFDLVFISSELKVAKPDLSIFKTACSLANIEPINCIYVGDEQESDIIPCHSLGIKAIWLNRKQTKSSGTTTISSLIDLKALL